MMATSFRNTPNSNASSDYEDVDFQYDYPDPYAPMFSAKEAATFDILTDEAGPGIKIKEPNIQNAGLSQSQLTNLKRQHFIDNSLRYDMYNKALFYQLQAELLVHKRRYREALGAVLVAEELAGRNLVLDAIKMICMYQLNDELKFKALKDELLNSRLDVFSETLKQQVIGTIQVSNWVPDFLNCLDSMKPQQQQQQQQHTLQ